MMDDALCQFYSGTDGQGAKLRVDGVFSIMAIIMAVIIAGIKKNVAQSLSPIF